jgi:hypothetical protein
MDDFCARFSQQRDMVHRNQRFILGDQDPFAG